MKYKNGYIIIYSLMAGKPTPNPQILKWLEHDLESRVARKKIEEKSEI